MWRARRICPAAEEEDTLEGHPSFPRTRNRENIAIAAHFWLHLIYLIVPLLRHRPIIVNSRTPRAGVLLHVTKRLNLGRARCD